MVGSYCYGSSDFRHSELELHHIEKHLPILGPSSTSQVVIVNVAPNSLSQFYWLDICFVCKF